MSLIRSIWGIVVGLARGDLELQRRPVVTPPPPRAERPTPAGWPEGYSSAPAPEGGIVVVVRGRRTRSPRWPTDDDARRDAWERCWSEEAEEEADRRAEEERGV